MRDVSPTGLVYWLAGHDFAGIGALTDLTDTYSALYQDVTPIGPKGRYRREAPIGQATYKQSEQGFARGRQASLRKMMLNAPDPPYDSIVGRYGNAMGAECRVITGLELEKDCLVQDRGSLTRIEMELLLGAEGDVNLGASILYAGDPVGVAVAAPYANYRHDSGARNPDGIVAAIMVDDDVVWDGGNRFTGMIRHTEGGLVLLQQRGTAHRGIRIGYGDADNTWTMRMVARGGNPISVTVDAANKRIDVRYAAADTLAQVFAAIPDSINAYYALANTDPTAAPEAPGGAARAFSNPVWATATSLTVAAVSIPGSKVVEIATAVGRYLAFAWTWAGGPGGDQTAKAITAFKQR